MKSSLKRAIQLPFANTKFDSSSYSAYRPSYGPSLFHQLYAYHKGPFGTAADIGCGTGQIAAVICDKFTKVYAFDTSAKMLESATARDNIVYAVGNAENLPVLETNSVDIVTVGQAAHWFDHEAWFKEMARILRKDGTLSFWSYNEIVFTDSDAASKIFVHFSHAEDKLGPHWPQPGRSILESAMDAVNPPENLFKDIERHYAAQRGSTEPSSVTKKVPFPMLEKYFRTTAAYHNWKEANPQSPSRSNGGTGDVIDEMLDEIKGVTGWTDEEQVDVHWPTVAVLARCKE